MTSRDFIRQMLSIANGVEQGKLALNSASLKGLKLLKGDKEINLQWLHDLDKTIAKSLNNNSLPSLVLAELNYRFAKLSKDEEILAHCALTYGKIAVGDSKPELAQKLLSEARSIFKKLDRSDGLADIASVMGKLHKALGHQKRAEKEYYQVLRISRASKNTSSEIAALNNLAVFFDDFQDRSKATTYYQQALHLAIKCHNLRPQLQTLENLAGLHRETRQFEKAAEYFSQAINTARSLDEKHEIAKLSMQLGSVYLEWEHLEQAVEHFEEARSLAEDTQNEDIQILCNGGLGLAFSRMVQWIAADSAFDKALKLARKYNRPDYEIIILNNIGYAYLDRGDPTRALEYHKKAYSLSEAAGKTQDQIGCLVNIGQAEVHIGKPEVALERLSEASKLITDETDFDLKVRMFGSLALTYLESGKIQQSQEYFEEALKYVRESGSTRQLGSLLLNMGLACRVANNITTALQFYEECIILAREIEDKGSEGSIHASLGDLYIIYGDTGKAKKEYQRALTLFRNVGDRSGILMVLLNFANLAVMQGMMDETRVFYLKMVRLARRWQLVKYEMDAKGYLGILLYRHMQQRKAGRDYLHQAIRLARQLDNPLMESNWSYHVANLLAEVGKHEKAAQIYEKELAFANEVGDLDHERAITVKLAFTCHIQKRDYNAYRYVKRAIFLTDQLRQGSLLEQHRISFMEERIDLYELSVTICLALGKNKEALEYVEKAKSRTLMDLVATIPMSVSRGPKKIRDLMRRESEILIQLRAMQNYDLFSLALKKQRSIKRPVKRFNVLVSELDSIYETLKAFDPGYVSLRRVAPITYKAIRESVSAESRI